MDVLHIIGDSDTLIAILNPEDTHNSTAEAILKKLTEKKASLYFPATTIAETITAFQRKMNNPTLAEQIVKACKAGKLQLLPVDDTLIALAMTFFNPLGSKQNTFFDAIVAACAKQYNADAIFSFDGWYRKVGLKLTSDLLEVKAEAA